jgi:hypothetical protein
MKIKKAIKELKKDNVHCWRKEENTYWVTNTYFIVKMDQDQFNLFKSKFSSLKRNPYIPDLEVGEKLSTYDKSLMNNTPNIESLFEGLEDFRSAEVSSFVFNSEFRLYYNENFVGLMQENYYQIFNDHSCKVRDAESPYSIIAFYNKNDELAGMAMPVRRDEFKNQSLKDELNSILSAFEVFV